MSLDGFQVVCNCLAKAKHAREWAQKAQQRNFPTDKYFHHTGLYSKYTAVYSCVYGGILSYWSLEYTAVYPQSRKWGIFKHNIDHHHLKTRDIPQLTYASIMHCTLVATCTYHIPLSPNTPFFTCILPGIPGMPGYAHRSLANIHFITSWDPQSVD